MQNICLFTLKLRNRCGLIIKLDYFLENALASMEEEKLKESKSDVDAVKESKEKEEDKKEVEEKKDVDKHGGDVCGNIHMTHQSSEDAITLVCFRNCYNKSE